LKTILNFTSLFSWMDFKVDITFSTMYIVLLRSICTFCNQTMEIQIKIITEIKFKNSVKTQLK
jgi:hypothetical protein